MMVDSEGSFSQRARLKLWRHEGPKASLHVTSEGAKGYCSSANWRLVKS